MRRPISGQIPTLGKRQADADCFGDLWRTEASGLVRAPGGRAFIDGGVRRKKMLLSRLDRGVAMAFLCVDCFQRGEA